MKRNDFWVNASNYSIAVCAIILIAKRFFRKYYCSNFVYRWHSFFGICHFGIYEIYPKEKIMKNYWKRFSFYDKGLAVFFMINLFLDVLNEKVLSSVIPGEIVSYLFWLSMGLYLGFQLCKYEYSHTLRKHSEEQKLN